MRNVGLGSWNLVLVVCSGFAAALGRPLHRALGERDVEEQMEEKRERLGAEKERAVRKWQPRQSVIPSEIKAIKGNCSHNKWKCETMWTACTSSRAG